MWIESHQTLREHPKTKMLARRLVVSRVTAIGHLHCLWWWALDYAQDGDLSKYDDEMLADAADWSGNAAAFVAALREAGFIDTDPARIHDWYDFAGKLVERRRVNAERMRETRAAHVQDTCSTRVASPDAARVGLPNLTVPNSTVPNPTVPNHDAPHGASPAAGPAKPKTAAQALFDVLVARFGEPANKEERGRYNRAVKLFDESGCDPAETGALIGEAEQRWPTIDITPLGVAGNVTTLRRPARSPPSKGQQAIETHAVELAAARRHLEGR